MSRRKSSTTDDLILLPWWVSAILAGVVFFGSIVLQTALSAEARGFAPTIGMLGFAFVLILLLISLKSFLRSFTTKRNLELQSGIDSLKSLDWKEFENLMGEIFRREGYSVAEQLGGGADGGVDLVLHRDGHKTLVQCKLRTRGSVGVSVVRELYGIISAERAFSGILVTTSSFTSEVHRFAANRPIRLIAGKELQHLVGSVQRAPGRAILPPGPSPFDKVTACPVCGNEMVQRTAKRGRNPGRRFLGCSTYPKCEGTLNL